MPTPDRHRRTAIGIGLGGLAALGASRDAAAQSGSVWDRIRSSGELRIGVAPSDPWFAKDAATGQWHGIGYAVGAQAAADLGVKLVGVETSWGNAVTALQAGQFDVMFVLDATPQRALAVDFPVQPMFYYAQGALLRDGLEAKRWSDLDRADLTIGVTLGTAPERDIAARMKLARVERFASNDQAVLAFQGRKVDALVFYHPALVMQRKRVNMGRVVLPEPLRVSATSAGLRREADRTWRDWLGLALDFYYTTGFTQTCYEDFLRWRGIDSADAPAVMREMWNKS
jgi:polar amino acid transport system substrate-binding protein